MTKNFLLVEHGGNRKQFTLDVLRDADIHMFIATSTIPDWLTEFVPRENIIETDTYNSVTLLSDIVAFFESKKITLDAIGTFFEHTVTQTADVANALNLPGIPPGAARKSSSNKLLMRTTCRDAGIPTPRFAIMTGLDSTQLEIAIKEVGTPCVLKPIFGSESYGTVKISDGYNLNEIISEVSEQTNTEKKEVFKNFKGTFLVEEYLPGPVISVDGIIQHKKIHIAGIVEFVMGPEPRFTQEANYIPARIEDTLADNAKKMAIRIIQVLGFDNCGFHCEMRLTPRGPVLLEIAARLPGGPLQPGHLRATGINLTKELLEVWLGKNVTFESLQKNYVLQKAVFPRTKGKVTHIEIPEIVKKHDSLWDFVLLVNEGEHLITYPDIPKPFYYYAISAASRDRLAQLAQQIESQVVIEVSS